MKSCKNACRLGCGSCAARVTGERYMLASLRLWRSCRLDGRSSCNSPSQSERLTERRGRSWSGEVAEPWRNWAFCKPSIRRPAIRRCVLQLCCEPPYCAEGHTWRIGKVGCRKILPGADGNTNRAAGGGCPRAPESVGSQGWTY